MTNEEALDVLRRQHMCNNTYVCPAKLCKRCPYYVDDKEKSEALKTAMIALELCVIVEDKE